MRVFRIANKKHILSLSGIGAEHFGGRWNHKGTRVVYTAASRALAMAETAVQPNFDILPDKYHIAEIEVPDDLPIYKIDLKSIFNGDEWTGPRGLLLTKAWGTYLISRKKYPIIKAPSVVVKGDFNYLLNPHHPEFDRIKIIHTEPFEFDERLFRGG
ncbi:MAG TPA: RES domain-containing protein [Pricia sp.]|nr:RES domain-containing protein [Pricia sp.]